MKTVVIAGYPVTFKEKELAALIGPETIKQISMKKNRAELTFHTVKLAKAAL